MTAQFLRRWLGWTILALFALSLACRSTPAPKRDDYPLPDPPTPEPTEIAPQ